MTETWRSYKTKNTQTFKPKWVNKDLCLDYNYPCGNPESISHSSIAVIQAPNSCFQRIRAAVFKKNLLAHTLLLHRLKPHTEVKCIIIHTTFSSTDLHSWTKWLLWESYDSEIHVSGYSHVHKWCKIKTDFILMNMDSFTNDTNCKISY